MRNIWIIFKRELSGYFTTPIAYIFMIVFLLLNGILTFHFGGFFAREQAELEPFFNYHPILYLVLIPALTMRLWAEERRSGTIELILTMPITMPQAVLGKYLAAWAFTAIALFMTVPVWITVNYLGEPDNGVILAGYIGSLVMAGAYLAIGSCVSSVTRNQIIAFVISAMICFVFILSGHPAVLELFGTWAPEFLVQTISSFSFLTHFQAISKGVIDLRDIVYFLSLISFWLYANIVLIEYKKAD